jgi:hypothetical protein
VPEPPPSGENALTPKNHQFQYLKIKSSYKNGRFIPDGQAGEAQEKLKN